MKKKEKYIYGYNSFNSIFNIGIHIFLISDFIDSVLNIEIILFIRDSFIIINILN